MGKAGATRLEEEIAAPDDFQGARDFNTLPVG